MLKKGGHNPKLLRTAFKRLPDIIEEVRKYRPSILCYSVMTGEQGYYTHLNESIKKEYDAFSLFGGPHPTFFPEMIEGEGVDAVCIGEGEYPMLELADTLESARSIDNIENLWIKKEGKIIRNRLRLLINDLNDIPFSDRGFLYEGDLEHARSSYKIFLASRGCPHRCAYCFNHSYNGLYSGKGQVVRRRSPDNIISEIEEVKCNYPLETVHFVDDAFLLTRQDWLNEFTTKYKERINLPFSCNFRPNYINEETVKKIKDAGCQWGWIGIECGNEQVSEEVLKRGLKNQQLLDACNILKNHGIRLATQNLNGLPVDNPLNVDMETLRLNLKIKPDFAWSSVLYPYPGTQIAEYANSNGYFNNIYDSKITNNKSLSLLDWKDNDTKTKVENLHKIFGVLVEYPFLIPIGKFLIRFKCLRGIFTFVYYSWYGYCHTFRLKRLKTSFKDKLKLVGELFRYLKKLKVT